MIFWTIERVFRHVWKAYDPTWIAVFFVFMNSFSKISFWQESLTQKLTVLPQADAKGCWHIWCTSFGLCLRQDSRVQRFVSHLNVLGSCRFLFSRWFWCVDLRKKLPSSGTSTYSFLRLLRLRSCGFVYVYVSRYTVIHKQSKFFRYYLVSRHFTGTKRRHIWELKLRNSKLAVRSKILGTCIGASMTLRRGTSLDVI